MTLPARRPFRPFKSLLLMASVLLVALPAAAESRSLYLSLGSGGPAGSVSVLNTTNNTFGPASITVGALPLGAAITPNGARAYVTSSGLGPGPPYGSTVTVIDTSTNLAIGGAITVGEAPVGVAITPDGTRAYVASLIGGTVSVIDTNPSSPTYNTVTKTISSGVPSPFMVGVSPDGSRAYATSGGMLFGGPGPFPNTVAVIDTSADATTGSAITTGSAPVGVAFTPDGGHAYVANGDAGTFSDVNTVSASVTPVTGAPGGPLFPAMTPDQGPTAGFTANAAGEGSATTFNGSASSDPDGTVARYDWDFGDGSSASDGGATPSHTYAQAGSYTVTLTVTDNEGASTQQVFTGQTMSRNGSSSARKSETVTIGDATAPEVKITSPKKNQKISRLKFKRVRGTATDRTGVEKVTYSLFTKKKVRKSKHTKKTTTLCRYAKRNGQLTRYRSCNKVSYLEASGTTSWSAKLKKVLPKGSYTLNARATDTLGKISEPVKVAFKLT